MNEDVTSLLGIISKINEKYEEIYKISGEKFNIFDILRVANTEKYHSRILATLLNPEGSHNKGSLFLEKFLKIVATKQETYAKDDKDVEGKVGEKFSIEGVRVQEEKSFDNGRPDITITNKNGKIILENKIWAEEGDKQLERYSKEEPIHLIYLTLFGIKAEKIGEGDFNYIKISYKKDIQEWLELCKKESVDNPILRETLTQYILLIRKLTGQTRSRDMEIEVIDAIIENSKYVSAALDIEGSIEAMKVRLVEKKYLEPLEEFAKNKGFEEFKPYLHGNQNTYFREWNFDINLKKKEWNYFSIELKFIKYGKGFLYGLLSKERDEFEKSKIIKYMPKIENEIKEEAKKFGYICCYDNSEQKWFLLHKEKNTSLWENWADTNFFRDIENSMEKMKNDFTNIIIEELSKICDRLEDKLKEM